MHPVIVNIQGRSEIGVSRPFLCQDDTGRSFFVKGNNVTGNQLALEYLFGHLAMAFGIEVAPFEIVEIPVPLSRQTLVRDRSGFDPGMAFASQRIPFGEEISDSHLRHIPDHVKMEIFCFDWWTGNSDRKRTLAGGCPNLLWDPMMSRVTAIDHDRVLDEDFDEDEFLREHVFRDIRPFLDKKTCDQLGKKFDAAVKKLKNNWKEIPGEWLDAGGGGEPGLSLEKIQADLAANRKGRPVKRLLIH